MLGFTSSVPGNFGDNWVSIPQHPWNHDSQSYPSTLLKHLNTPDSALLSKMSFCYFLWHSSLFIPTYVSSQSIAVSFLHLPFLFTPLYLPRFISSIFLLIFSVKSESTKNIGDENWALLLEEECDSTQIVAEDLVGRFGGAFSWSLESFVSLKTD